MRTFLKICSLSLLSCFFFLTEASAQRFNQPSFFEEGNEQFERMIEELEQSKPAPVLTLDEERQQWQPITSQTGGFSVWLPLGILSDHSETLPLEEATLNFRMLSSQTATGKFVVAYANVPNIEASELFAAVKEAMVERTAFEISTREKIAVEGSIGESLILIGDAELISAYVLLGNARMYVVGVRHMEDTASSEIVNKFLNSFQLNIN